MVYLDIKVVCVFQILRYSIHPQLTKMYRDLREVYWRNGINKDIAGFVAKCQNCQQVKVEHKKWEVCPKILTFLRESEKILT